MKKALSLLLVLALALAIFALPAAAETHDHDGCCESTSIQPRIVSPQCPYCSAPSVKEGKGYRCSNGHFFYA
ncbi:hypothetical protein [uncultured Neglectibacter sp.]|uniref:hypothetical protein n=1 Tax=uncultured Neglectibacter sp. TaxID=1924108 RepID=UPI0034DECF8C